MEISKYFPYGISPFNYVFCFIKNAFDIMAKIPLIPLLKHLIYQCMMNLSYETRI